MSIYTLYLEPNELNGLYAVDLGHTQVQLNEKQKESLLKLIKATDKYVLGVKRNTIIYTDEGQLYKVLPKKLGGSRRQRVRKSSRKSSSRKISRSN
jgi:alpha-D-ribose 1-methylphosphonate 5-triphosphate synthase subunit PhnL